MRLHLFLAAVLVTVMATCEKSSPQDSASARQFVKAFYDWYSPIARANHDGPAWNAVLRERAALLDRPLLDALRADSAAQAQAPGEIAGLDFDPFLYSQDPCETYEVGPVSRFEEHYNVQVFGRCSLANAASPDVVAEVARDHGSWVLVNVHYAADGTNLLAILGSVLHATSHALLAQEPVNKVIFFPELGFVCEWEPRSPSTKRVVVDLSLHASNYGRIPNAEDVRAVQAAGGRVLYQFRVALLRAELDTGAVRALVKGRAAIANAAFTVPDTTKFDARVQIFYGRAITDSDKEALRALGVLEVDQSPSPVLEAWVPDSLVSLIAALPGVQFVRATGWGCAAPEHGQRTRRP